jgi:hypothetical protein
VAHTASSPPRTPRSSFGSGRTTAEVCGINPQRHTCVLIARHLANDHALRTSKLAGGGCARRTATGLPRAVNLMVASCHHALPWHKAKGGGCARRTPTGLSRAVNLMVASCHHALPWHKAKGGGARRTATGVSPGRWAGGDGPHLWRNDPATHQGRIRNKLRPAAH